MSISLKIVVGFIAFLHLYIMWFEMFAWASKGKKIFSSLPKDLFEQTKPMAANQGLYNGFLAAGLIWTFFISNIEWQNNITLFFLSCVAIAGLYGTFTVDKKILIVQTIPASIGIILLLLQ
jgi:putative membrane protein